MGESVHECGGPAFRRVWVDTRRDPVCPPRHDRLQELPRLSVSRCSDEHCIDDPIPFSRHLRRDNRESESDFPQRRQDLVDNAAYSSDPCRDAPGLPELCRPESVPPGSCRKTETPLQPHSGYNFPTLGDIPPADRIVREFLLRVKIEIEQRYKPGRLIDVLA